MFLQFRGNQVVEPRPRVTMRSSQILLSRLSKRNHRWSKASFARLNNHQYAVLVTNLQWVDSVIKITHHRKSRKLPQQWMRFLNGVRIRRTNGRMRSALRIGITKLAVIDKHKCLCVIYKLLIASLYFLI